MDRLPALQERRAGKARVDERANQSGKGGVGNVWVHAAAAAGGEQNPKGGYLRRKTFRSTMCSGAGL